MSSYVPKIEGPANPSEDSFQINPFTYRPQGYIQDDWALRLDPATTPDNELRAGAYAIMSQAFGIRDNDGRTFSGVDHKALTGAEYYAKAKESWEKGRLPYTDDWNAYWEAESAGDRAAMRKIAKENYRGEGAGDDAAALIDRNDNFGAANTYGSDDERDERIRGELESIKDAIAPDDWAQVEAYFGREGEEDSPSARKSRAANRLQELNARLHEIERETISVPAYQETGFEDEIAKIGEEQQALEAELEGMDAEVVESRGAVDAVRRKYYDTIRDEQRLAKYEKQLLDDNLFAQVESVKRVVSDDARKVIEMAQDAGENPTAKPVLDAFEKLPTEDQRAIAGVLQSLHYGRDTTLLGDCFRSFWDTTRQTFGGAIRGAADTVRRSFMDAQDYRDYVERRSLLESVNQERAKEWGYLGKSVIGAFSTIPYMAAAAIPYAGTSIVMASAADQFQSEAALNGVDVGSRDFALARWAFAGAYAAVEKAQLLPFKPIGAFSRRQAYCEMFSTLRGAILVPGAIVGNAVSETLEEGVQGGIERVVESWGLDSNAAQDFARGFAQDFVDSFGTMVLVGGGAVGMQAYRYRNGAIGLDKTEQIGALAQARDTANAMEGHLDSPPQPLSRFGKVWGRMSGDWLNAGTDAKARVQALERWGFTHEQASEMHGYLDTIWSKVSANEKLRNEFVGGNRVLDAAHLAAKVFRTEVTTDKETGVQHVEFRIGKRNIRLDFNPGDTLSHVVDPETQDEGMIYSIVEGLNRNEKMVGGSGNLTVEGWKALTPEQRAERVKGWRVNGNIQLLAPDGTKVSRDALKKLVGDVGGRIITTDTALPQTVLHETMHGVLAILQADAAQGDAEAKALQDSLAKFFPAQNAQEAVNEELLADTFQEWVSDKVDVVEATDTLSALRRFIEKYLGDADVALADLLNKRSEAGRLFALALTGDISPALEKEEGTKTEPEGTKPAEPAAPSPAQQRLAELEAELAAMPREEIAKRQRLENRIAEARRKVEREGGGTRFSIELVHPWPENFPKVMVHTTRAAVMAKHAEDFAAAKAGDWEAAVRLVQNAVKPDRITALVSRHPNAIVVPVRAQEATGRNMIPSAYAAAIADAGLELGSGIVQSVRAYHSGANAEGRILRSAQFDGPVQAGREYVIVDDHITQGGTLNELRNYIENKGGKVVEISCLTASKGSTILPIRKATLHELAEKFGPSLEDELRSAEITGRLDALTESQGRYLLKLSPNTLRDRIIAAGLPGGGNEDGGQVREPVQVGGTSRSSLSSVPSAEQLAEARRQYDEVVAKYRGTDKWLKAPNGKNTNLSERQWVQVRTPAFKAWFGDWENDPANASRVVDENGEPLVVYHSGTFGVENDETVANGPMHFGTLEAANQRITGKRHEDMVNSIETWENSDGTWSASIEGDEVVGGEETESAARARAEYLARESDIDDFYYEEKPGAYFLNIRKMDATSDQGQNWTKAIDDAIAGNYDGIAYRNEYEDAGSTSYIAFNPNQIKSATDNVGTFFGEDPDIRYSIRKEAPPTKTGIGYKVFYRGKDGKLYPPMIANPGGADTPVGVWLDADAAPIAGTSKTGRPKVKQGGKGTQGGSGFLAYRPGWHLGEIPYAIQFNRRDENGERTLFPKDFVWAEVEYAADEDYQKEAEAEGMTPDGKFRHSYAGLKRLPKNGFYRYRTNPDPATDPWIITGAMKVNRVLSDEEVDALVRAAGREPQRRESDTRFSLSSPVERTPDLVAFHNASASGLKGMDELGGLAMPSFAVTKDSIGGNEFGEITLLVRPDVIDPTDRTNRIFSNDAWTPTFPSVRLRAVPKMVERAQDRFRDIFTKKADGPWKGFADGWSSVTGDAEYFDDLLNRFDDIEAALRGRDVFKAAFLVDTGRAFPLPTREEEVFRSGFGAGFLVYADNKAVAAISQSPLGDRLVPNGEALNYQEAEELVKDEDFLKSLQQTVLENSASFEAIGERFRGLELAKWAKTKPELAGYKLRDLADAVDYWRRNGGAGQTLDRGAATKAVDEAIEKNRAAYDAWIKEFSAGLTDGKRYIRNDKDVYTPSGNRRPFEKLYDPLTLAAAVRAMLKQQNDQGNGFLGRNPFGVAAKEFKSLEAVIKDEDRLKKLPAEEVKKLKEALTARLSELVIEYEKTQASPDENPFTAHSRAADMMMDAYAVAKGNKARLSRELNGWGYRASEEFVDAFLDVMNDMASMPEDYFEAKAYRAVHFDEIAEALVPDNADAETVDILRRRGVPFRTYKAGDNSDRLRALNEAATDRDARFSISGPVGAESLGIRNLPDAEAMERSGASRLDIWRETGWWRGKDGQWRVEIPDFELLADAPRMLLASGTAHLADLIPPDSAILKAYPSLGKMRIDVVESNSFSGRNNGISIDIDRESLSSPDRLRSTLAHEIQHSLQTIEGFALGGNTEMRTSQFSQDPQASRLLARVNHLLSSARRAMRFYQSAVGTANENPHEIVRLGDKILALESQKRQLKRLGVKADRRIGYRGYLNLAGEAEARLVQKRLAMTPEERAARPPWEDFDVAEADQLVLGVEQTLPKAVVESPHYDGIDEDTDAPRFSISTYEQGGRRMLSAYLDVAVSKGDLLRRDADDILRETDFVAGIAKRFAKDKRFRDFGAWSKAVVETDDEGRPMFGVVRSNGDYAMNIDFSTVCKKRRPMDRIFARLVRDGVLTGANVDELSGEAVAGIQRIIKAHGLEVACALCFVDAKRYRLGEVAKRFADGGRTSEGKSFAGWNNLVAMQAEGGRKWADRVKKAKGKTDFESRCVRAIESDPSVRVRVEGSQLVSSEGMDALAKNAPGIYELWRSYGGTSHAKDSHWDAPYNNDVIRPFKSRTNPDGYQFDPKKAFAIGGVRLQSFSDFVGRMFFDYVQMFAELAAKKLPLHVYTKEPNFVKLFHLTNAKINMSLVPAVVDGGVAPGLDADGNYAWADECFPPDEAFALRQLGGNVGTIAVGVSDEHIRKLLRDPTIDMVIPYHKSGINPVVASIRKIDQFKDYSNVQNTMNAKRTAYKGKEHFDFYGSLAKTKNPKKTAREYVAWCKERNLLPKFDAFANEENYYKLLEDFRLYDENGKYAPQDAVRQKYPENVGQLVEESLELNQSEESAYLENEDEIVREIEDSILRPQQGLDARLKSAMDEAAAAAGQAARASISWNGPAYSYRSFATAYAARDRILGIERPDDDYAQLLAALGIEDYPIEDLRREAEKIGAEGVRQDADDLAKLAGLAENRSFRRTVERLLSGSLHLGTEVGASARAAHDAYLAHMRRTAKGRDYDDFCRDLGMDPAALALSIAESSFDPDAPAPKNPATGAEPAPAADGQPASSQPEMDGDLAALLDGKAADFGLTEEQLRERVNARYEQRTQEIKDRLERLRARLDEWRVKEAQRKKRLAERQAAEGKTDEKPDLTDEEMFDAETNETEAGAKRLADFESECVEEMPDFQAFLEECRNEGLDLGNAAEFVAAVRLWVEDFIARETGSADPKKALRDPVALARYRATMMRFLHGMADAMLDPEDGLAAKTAERMMQEIPSDATVGEIDSRARVLVAFIQRNGIRQTRKQLVRELRKQIKLLAIRGKKFDEMEKDVGRKLTGEREAAARYLYRILTWSDGMVAKESQRLHDIVSGREAAYRASGADDEALRDLARTDREVHRATERLQMLRDYGSLRKKSPAEIKLAAKAIVEWLEKGREQHEKRWNDWHAALDELAARVAKAASASAKDYTPEDPGFVGKLADELTATVRQRLERIFAGSGADGQKAIDEVMRLVYLGSERMQTEKVRARQRTDRLLEQCVQGTGRTVNDFLKSLDELIPEDLNRALKTDEQPVRMTNGQALQLLASLEQTASYEGNVEANFRGATDRDGNPQIPHADLLRRYFEDKPEMVRLLEGVREVYDERREELSDAFLAVTGNPILAPDPLYAPVRMFRGSSEGFETRVKAWDPFGPALTPRVKNTLDFDLRASILDLYEARTRETCRVLAWGLPGMELRSVLCRKEVQDAIARTHGKFALRQLVAHLTDVVSDGWEDEPSGYKALAQKLGSATTYSALSWNVVTMLKQMTSIPAWTALMDGGYSEVFKNIVSFDRAAAKELMAEPGFVARYGADSFAKMFKDALDDPRGGNLLQRFFAAGMTAVQIGDFVPGILVGTGVYKARKEALMRSGMEERQAREEAARIAWGLVEECQQSSRIENSPAFLRRGGFMARQAAKFASSPLLQVSHEWHTLRMWAAEASAEAVKAGRGGNLVSRMLSAQGEDAKRWRRRFVNQVICNHVLMPGAMYAVATAFNLALGSEPPDEEEVLGDVVMQMLSGPFSRIFLIGMVFDKGGEAVARMMGGKPNVYDSTGLASQQYLQKVFGQIGRIGGDVADADWESVRDDFLKMLGQVSAPARYAVKAGQNIAGYDPAEARRERKAELRKAQ